MTDTALRQWRVERSVTLGVVVALALQTGGALIWAGAAGERLARLEEQMEQARESLARIERRLDRN